MKDFSLKTSQSPKANRVTLGVVALFFGVAVLQAFSEKPSAVVAKLSDKIDLAGTWQTCVLNEGKLSSISGKITFEGHSVDLLCTWTNEVVPNSISLKRLETEKGWIVFRKQFQTPNFCNDTSPCNFIASEVGDAALVVVNQKEVGIHGGLPPRERYARHYPVDVAIPNSLFSPSGSNELWIVVRYLKKEQSGILRGPLAIVPADDAFSVSRRILIQNVLLPLMSATGVALMAVLGILLVLMGRARNLKTNAYLRYCFASALFLTSYTSLPREVLPLSMTGCLHFLFRFLMDCTFVEMALVFTGWKLGLRKWIRSLYGLALSVFILQFTLPSIFGVNLQGWEGFSGAVRWSRVIDYTLIFGAYFLGTVAVIINRKRMSPAVVITFTLSSMLALAGCMTFHGVPNLPYFVHIYPFFIALIMGIEISIEVIMEGERIKRDALLGDVTQAIVHNLKSPLTSMWRNLELASELSPRRAQSMKELCQRMGDMVNDIIPSAERLLAESYPSNVNTVANLPKVEVNHLPSLLEGVVSSKRIVVGNSPEIYLDISEGIAVFAKVNPTTLKQVVTNLLDNAVDALKDRKNGIIEVSLREEKGKAIITVHDNGGGIPADVLKRIGEKGFTSGKENGNGLGIHYCIEVLRKVGGCLEINSVIDGGTKMTIIMPSEPTPHWFAKSIVLSEDSRAIILDDDPGIREMWRERFDEISVTAIIFGTTQKVKAFIEASLTEKDVLLFDHELFGENETGLDLLSSVSIPSRCYLVTSYFNDPEVIRRCQQLGVKLIPKSAIRLIDIDDNATRAMLPGLRLAEVLTDPQKERTSEAIE